MICRVQNLVVATLSNNGSRNDSCGYYQVDQLARYLDGTRHLSLQNETCQSPPGLDMGVVSPSCRPWLCIHLQCWPRVTRLNVCSTQPATFHHRRGDCCGARSSVVIPLGSSTNITSHCTKSAILEQSAYQQGVSLQYRNLWMPTISLKHAHLFAAQQKL